MKKVLYYLFVGLAAAGLLCLPGCDSSNNNSGGGTTEDASTETSPMSLAGTWSVSFASGPFTQGTFVIDAKGVVTSLSMATGCPAGTNAILVQGTFSVKTDGSVTGEVTFGCAAPNAQPDSYGRWNFTLSAKTAKLLEGLADMYALGPADIVTSILLVLPDIGVVLNR